MKKKLGWGLVAIQWLFCVSVPSINMLLTTNCTWVRNIACVVEVFNIRPWGTASVTTKSILRPSQLLLWANDGDDIDDDNNGDDNDDGDKKNEDRDDDND